MGRMSPFFDELFWCPECYESKLNLCDAHGAPHVIRDRKLQPRARQTVPHMLQCQVLEYRFGDHNIHGIFAKKTLTKNIMFGPLEAPPHDTVTDTPEEGRLLFNLFSCGGGCTTLNTADEDACNWMIYVRTAAHPDDQNLTAVQHHGQVYFFTTKNIMSGKELLVWYNPDYARMMGVSTVAGQLEADEMSELAQIPEPVITASARNMTSKPRLAPKRKSLSGVKKHGLNSRKKQPRKPPAERCGVNIQQVLRKQRVGGDAEKSTVMSAAQELMLQQRVAEDIQSIGTESHGAGFASDVAEVELHTLENSTTAEPGHLPGLTTAQFNQSTAAAGLNVSLAADRQHGADDEDHTDSNYELETLTELSRHATDEPGSMPPLLVTLNSKCDIIIKSPETADVNQIQENPVYQHDRPLRSKFECSTCSKVFPSNNLLLEHSSVEHVSDRPHQCPEPNCGKSFRTMYKLNRHQAVHGKGKKFTCSYCQHVFLRSDHLKSHLKTHSAEREEFKCTKCSKLYQSNQFFKLHMAFHSMDEGALTCGVCKKAMTTKEELECHLGRHAGRRSVKDPSEKKFPCPECPMTFYGRKDLQRHSFVHSKQKNIMCHLCPNRFHRKDHLTRHILVVHEGKTASGHMKKLKKKKTSTNVGSEGASIHTPDQIKNKPVPKARFRRKKSNSGNALPAAVKDLFVAQNRNLTEEEKQTALFMANLPQYPAQAGQLGINPDTNTLQLIPANALHLTLPAIIPAQQNNQVFPGGFTVQHVDLQVAPAQQMAVPNQQVTAPSQQVVARAQQVVAHGQQVVAPAQQVVSPAQQVVAHGQQGVAPTQQQAVSASGLVHMRHPLKSELTQVTAAASTTTAVAQLARADTLIFPEPAANIQSGVSDIQQLLLANNLGNIQSFDMQDIDMTALLSQNQISYSSISGEKPSAQASKLLLHAGGKGRALGAVDNLNTFHLSSTSAVPLPSNVVQVSYGNTMVTGETVTTVATIPSTDYQLSVHNQQQLSNIDSIQLQNFTALPSKSNAQPPNMEPLMSTISLDEISFSALYGSGAKNASAVQIVGLPGVPLENPSKQPVATQKNKAARPRVVLAQPTHGHALLPQAISKLNTPEIQVASPSHNNLLQPTLSQRLPSKLYTNSFPSFSGAAESVFLDAQAEKSEEKS